MNVAENKSKGFFEFGKSRKYDIRDSYKEITTIVVAPGTSRHQMVTTMSKLLHVSRKTLHKHTKFKVQGDENDEAPYWALICKQPHQDRILARIKEKVVYFWDTHSCAIPD